MKQIIEFQSRLLIGTIVMWVVASLIFGANLTTFGVTSVIRWATYIQGALLVTTMVGWPKSTYTMLYDFFLWAIKFNNEHGIFTSVRKKEESYIQSDVHVGSKVDSDEAVALLEGFEMELAKDMIQSDGTIDNKPEAVYAEDFLSAVEEGLRKQLPPGVGDSSHRNELRKSMSDNEKVRFDALWMALDNIETARMILQTKVPKSVV